MRGPLWVKLILAFAMITLICGGIILGVLSWMIPKQFKVYVRTGDVVAARAMAPLLEEYYTENGSWEGMLLYLAREPVKRKEEHPPPVVAGERGRMMGMMMHQGSDISRRVVITDRTGLVLVDSMGVLVGKELGTSSGGEGIVLFSGRTAVGILYMGTMIEPVLNPLGISFLEQINRSVLMAVISVLGISLILSLIIVKHITQPLKRMQRVARTISKGDFSIRTNLNRRDELGELASGIDEMAESLEKSEEWKRRIISDSAHELRTPVTLLQGSLEMMIDGIYPLERDRIRGLHDETLHLSRLIEDLQALASLEAREEKLKKEKSDLPLIAREVAASFLPVMKEAEVDLVVSSGSVSPVSADPVKVKQIFLNLFSNALRYAPSGSMISVDFEKDEEENRLWVSVNNSGPAIPEDKLSRIFERFFRVEKSRNRSEGGRGLGLAICAEIVRAHGGRITAENLPGDGGVKFAFFLPLDI